MWHMYGVGPVPEPEVRSVVVDGNVTREREQSWQKAPGLGSAQAVLHEQRLGLDGAAAWDARAEARWAAWERTPEASRVRKLFRWRRSRTAGLFGTAMTAATAASIVTPH